MNNKKSGKSPRGFNVLDILILLILAAILAGGWYLYAQYTESLEKTKYAVEYQVELKGIDNNFVDAITQGDPLRESVKGNNLGNVAAINPSAAVNINADYTNGRYMAVAVPNKQDLILTISSTADVSERSIVVGGLEIKIGQKIYVKGKGYAKEGYIINIKVKK